MNMIFDLNLSDKNTLTDKYIDNLFFTYKDKKVLIENFITDYDIECFFNEIRQFFNKTWEEKYKINHDIKSFDDLNKILEDYPSTGGYMILENTFTAVDTTNINNISKEILGYFYSIHLR